MIRRLRMAVAIAVFAIAGLGQFSLPSAVGQTPQAANILVSDVGSNSIKLFNGSNGAYMGVFAHGGGLSTPFGMGIGPDGNLYVASLGTSSILEYNGRTGSFLGTFASLGSGGLYYPNQIAFGPDGNLYVSSYTANAVLKFEGPSSSQPSGTPDGIFATAPGLQGPTGLTFNQNKDGSSTLFVNSSQNGQVFQFNSTTGALLGGGPYLNDPSHLSGPAGLAFGPNGNLFETSFTPAPSNKNMEIVQYNTSGSGTFSNLFTSGALLNGPADVAFDSNVNKMYVTSYNNSAIYRFGALTGSSSDMGNPFIDSTNLSNPTYLILVPPAVGSGIPNVSVPEPTSLALLGIGALALYGYSRRRRALARATA